MDKDQAKFAIQKLVDKYEEVLKSGTKNKFTEEETKKGFIVPLFTALGWDMEEKSDVSAEEHISGDRVDYGFYINGRPKFYLETKPFKADLNDPKYARQAIKYSWNKGVTWAVLSDFESIKVFNADFQSEELSHSKFFEISWDKYGEDFDRLWFLSKESFENGDIDKKAEEWGKALKRVSVTDALYKDLTESRKLLTDSLKRWNEKVSDDLLGEGVQKLLNRLVFIRVLEDRNIEPQILKTIVREWESDHYEKERPPLYLSLVKKFRELDAQYNSNLFDEHPFEKWEEYDNYTKKVIDILYGKSGYYEYDFKIIPADILGAVYENYLGYKLEQLKKGSKAGQDSKKRKEHGIYYTPEFIVDYIIKNTLNPILQKCQTIDDLMKIKVLDPACGSGSFLIKAVDAIYQRYHEMSFRGSSTYKKIQIITQNIYGVDLDSQAVEIARLNLLINAVEEKILLPSLAKNIKNGNSLISGTDEELEKYFGKNWQDKKPFDWQDQFSEVFKQGGFDVVIGNPPYLSIERGFLEDINFFKQKYLTIEKIYDIFGIFVEHGVNLLRQNGRLGFIMPNIVLSNDSFRSLRKFILDTTSIISINNYKDGIFSEAIVPTAVLILEKNQIKADILVSVFEKNKLVQESSVGQDSFYDQSMFRFNVISNQEVVGIQNKAYKDSKHLKHILKIQEALKTGDDKRFIFKDAQGLKNPKVLLKGADIDRYRIINERFIDYQKELLKRPGKEEVFNLPEKIYIRRIANRIICVLDNKQRYAVHTLYTGVLLDNAFTYSYVLGLLNSKLFTFIYKTLFPFKGNIFPEVRIGNLGELPIRIIDKNYQNIFKDLVTRLTKLNNEVEKSEKNSDKWNKLKYEIEKTDKLIDQKVYGLYGLTEEEIKIVEN